MRILVPFVCGKLEPPGGITIVLLTAEARGIQFADPVLRIAFFLLPLNSIESGQRLAVPHMGGLHINLPAQPVRKHPAQIVHGQRIAFLRLLLEQGKRLLKILGLILAAKQTAAGQAVLIAPVHLRFGWRRHRFVWDIVRWGLREIIPVIIRLGRLRQRRFFLVLHRDTVLLVIWMENLLARPQCYRFLNDDVFDPLEFLLLGKGKAWRQVVLVGAQHIFPQFIPQGIGCGDTWLFGQLVHNLIHYSLQRSLEVAVLLPASGVPQAFRQMLHELLHAVVDHGAAPHLFNQLLQHRAGVLIQRVPTLGLLLVKLRQLLPEDLFCQSRLDLGDALRGEEAFRRIGAVADHVDMGMVCFIMECSVPPEILPGDLRRLRHFHGILGEQCFPFFRLVIAEAGGVFPPQRDDGQPHITGVGRDRFRYLRQYELIFLTGKQSMGTDALGAGAGGDVLQIVILLGDLVIVVLQSASDELRCVGACRLGRIVLVFKHPTAEREVPQDLFHHLFLL